MEILKNLAGVAALLILSIPAFLSKGIRIVSKLIMRGTILFSLQCNKAGLYIMNNLFSKKYLPIDCFIKAVVNDEHLHTLLSDLDKLGK